MSSHAATPHHKKCAILPIQMQHTTEITQAEASLHGHAFCGGLPIRSLAAEYYRTPREERKRPRHTFELGYISVAVTNIPAYSTISGITPIQLGRFSYDTDMTRYSPLASEASGGRRIGICSTVEWVCWRCVLGCGGEAAGRCRAPAHEKRRDSYNIVKESIQTK